VVACLLNDGGGEGGYRGFITTSEQIVNVHEIVSESWQLLRATLINVVNQNEVENNEKGVLILTTVNKESGERQNGTVCKDIFNWRSAHLFCQSSGYVFADWGSDQAKRQAKGYAYYNLASYHVFVVIMEL
jgi:hypothetical protein